MLLLTTVETKERRIMPNRNDRDSDKPRHMPETAEVGSEGGSYADATVQEATDTGDLPRVKRADREHNRNGAVANAVPATPDSPEDGVRTPDDTFVMPD
jgi:hypothetical protein